MDRHQIELDRWKSRQCRKDFRQWAFDELAWGYGPAAAGRAMQGASIETLWDLMGDMGEALDLGEPLPIIDPDDICTDDHWSGSASLASGPSRQGTAASSRTHLIVDRR